MILELTNGERYEMDLARLTETATRIVVDPHQALVVFLCADGLAGFWGLFGDLGTAMGHAAFIARRGDGRIPVGLCDCRLVEA